MDPGPDAPLRHHHASTLGLATIPRLEPPPTSKDFTDSIELAWSAGVRGAPITPAWSELEPSPKHFATAALGESVSDLGASRGFTLFVALRVINTTVKETPADLLGTAWDAPATMSRFHGLLMCPLILHSHVEYLAIGNEVNIHPAAHPSEWSAYRTFYEDAVAYVHEKKPGSRSASPAPSPAASVSTPTSARRSLPTATS